MTVKRRRNLALRDGIERGENTAEWLMAVIRLAKLSKISFMKFKEILKRVFEKKGWSRKRFAAYFNKNHWNAIAV